jgi:hypothetical protein
LFPKSGGTKQESRDLINQIKLPVVPHAETALQNNQLETV